MITSRPLRAPLLCLAALLAATPPASGQLDGLPRRQPESSIKHMVKIDVAWSRLGFGDGRRETYEGKVAFHKPEADGDPETKEHDHDYHVVSDIWLRDGDGRMVEPAGDLRFRVDKTGAPIGGPETPRSLEEAGELTRRLVASTDFCLIPLRMLFRHEMPSGRGNRATLEARGDGHRVHWSERFGGVETISRTSTMRYESVVTRTFEPSGYRLVDHALTFEDERDDTVLASFAIRMVTHPTMTTPGGDRPPGGVFHIAFVRVFQLDWLKESPIFNLTIWDSHVDKWYGRLADQLFDDIENEAFGDPSDSPSAFALRALGILEPRTVGRIVGRATPRSLAVIAPHLVDHALPYHPEGFLDGLDIALDPRQRLRLAAAAAAAGHHGERITDLARVGLASGDPAVRLDAFRLARSLRDPTLNDAVTAGLAKTSRDDVLVEGLLALGAAGGAGSVEGVTSVLVNPTSDRVKAAAFRALADTGEAGAAELIDDANARAGAISPETGRFELWIDRPDEAIDALLDVHRFAAAARANDVDTVLSWLGNALRDEKTNQPDKILRLDTAREWLPRLASIVPILADSLEGHSDSELARLVVRSSGRERVEEILDDLRKAETKADKMMLARLVGATKDPRARDVLVAMQDSEDLEDFEAGAEGLDMMEQDD